MKARRAAVLLAVAVALPGPLPAAPACPQPGRDELLAALNLARATGGRCGGLGERPPAVALAWNSDLAEAARRQAQWLATHGTLVHTGPAGEPLAERVRAAGYAFRRISENLALGQATAPEVVADWLGSEGHCVNLLDGAAQDVGVAVACNPQGEAIWVMVAGRR